MHDAAVEAIDELEGLLRSHDDVPPREALRLRKLLDEPQIKDIVALVERSNAVCYRVIVPSRFSMPWTLLIRPT